MINRITENGDDIWQLLAHCLQSFHVRVGTLKTADTPAANIGPSMHDEQIIEVTKDLVLPIALVILHALYIASISIADPDFLGLDEIRSARNVRG
jgi:hypothetical protein